MLRFCLVALPVTLLSVVLTSAGTRGGPQEDVQPALVQLRLEGQAAESGSRTLLEITAEVDGELRFSSVSMFVGAGTSGAEVAALLAARFRAGGVELVHVQGENGAASLFLERVTAVALEFGGGLSATLTACEGSSASVRIESKSTSHPAKFTLSTGTFSQHDGRRATTATIVSLEADTTAPLAATRLMEIAAESGLLSEKPGGDAWRPVKLRTGEKVSGLSLRLESRGNWRVEMEM